MLGDLEGFVCHVNQEIVVLLLVMVGSRRVADDAETDEWHFVDVAGLCDGYGFHIHSQSFGEIAFDFAEFFLRGDELVARADESCMDAGVVES